jgi:ferritin
LIMTDNQFIDWYVDTLTIKEVIAALKAVEIKVNKKKNAYDMLKSAWKKGPNSLQVAISAYFDEQHKEAREEINSKSRDECRNELNDLVTRFGVKSMVFVLIINSDRFKKEIGYQLVNERGDEVEPVEDDGDDDFEAGDEAIQDGNGSEGDILNKLEEIADVFHGGQIIEDVEKIDAAVNSLLKSWQDFKKHRSQRQEYLSEISNYLKQLKEHNTVLEYFLVIPGKPTYLRRE